MKIAIVGYGKMGHIIEEVARERGHRIVCTFDGRPEESFDSPEFRSADVAIEFSQPSVAVDNILGAFAAGVPVVSGTTGWTDSLPEIREMCRKGRGTLLYASNFSIGVNIFMAMNRWLASVMNDFPQYDPEMQETHHIHKLDHPSGTAITLARELVARVERITSWQEPSPGTDIDRRRTLEVSHVREGEVPGIHTVRWESESDSITITHSAKTRRGFALGAVMAAEWLKGKKGYFTMGEFLSDLTKTTGLFTTD